MVQRRPTAINSTRARVLIRCIIPSINYKDALAATGAGKVIRRFPCVGGIDLSGEVVGARRAIQAGDPVIATSFDIGGFASWRLAAEIRAFRSLGGALPVGISSKRWRSAPPGFTAALGVVRMEANGLAPANGLYWSPARPAGWAGLPVDMMSGLGYGSLR